MSGAKKRFVIMTGALFLAPAAFAQPSGQLSGVVVGDDGQPLVAVVVANRAGTPPASGHAESAVDGSFSISGLSPGVYDLCASVKGGGYLDPCAWSPELPTARIAAGQATTGYRLVLKKGSKLQVRVNDLTKVLESPPASGKSAPHLIIGVMTERHLFQPLMVTSKDATGRNQEGTVPSDKAVSLHVVGRDVDVQDTNGAKVDITGSTTTINPVGTNAATTNGSPHATFNVSPKQP